MDKVAEAEQAEENTLIDAVKAGNRMAYHKLYEKHVGRVYALMLRLTSERASAEDLTQEVFIQVWNKISSFRGDSRFSTWLHRVATNHALSYLRKQKSGIQLVSDEDAPEAEEPNMPAPDTGDAGLDKLIARLPQQARMVFVLQAVEGYRQDEIAEKLGIATGSVKAQFHRAKQLLRGWLES